MFKQRNFSQPSQLLILSLLLFLAGLLFFPVIHGYWLADDFYWVRDLLHYDWREIPKLFLGDWPRENEYRPLWSVSYVMDLMVWGADARGLHLTSIILHIVASALVWYLVKVMVQDHTLAALLSLAFFVLHPVHTEPVSWIAARGHVLVTIFILSSIIFMHRFQRYGGGGNYLASLVAAVAAFTTQEAAAALPPLLLLKELVYLPSLDRHQFARILKWHSPFWVLLGLYLTLRMVLFGSFSSDRLVSPLQEFLRRVYISNRTLWLSPASIADVPHALTGLRMVWLLFLLITILLLIPFTFLRSSELKEYAREFIYFAIGWPLITTLVYLGADSQRHLYLASVGLCVAFGLAIARLLTAKGWLPIYGAIVAAFLFFVYGWSLVTGVAGFARHGERSLQLRHEVDGAIERASQDTNATVIVIPEIPNQQWVLWDYFYPAAVQPPFTQHFPSVTVLPSFASCHCPPDEWMTENGASLVHLVHDVTGPIYLVEWDIQQASFVTHLLSQEDLKKAGYLTSNGPFLRSRKPGEVILVP